MPGWKNLPPEEWSRIAKEGYNALPDKIKDYIDKIEEILGTELAIISIGPNRSDTIIRKSMW